VKGSWSETWKNYRKLLGASILKIPKEKDLFCESYEILKILCQIWFFGYISLVWAFLDQQIWDLINHKGFYM
jgi:hypothetical protein